MRWSYTGAALAAVIVLASCEPILGPLPDINTRELAVTSSVSGTVEDVDAAIEWESSLALGESPDLSYSVIVDYPDSLAGSGRRWRFSGLTGQELALRYLPLVNGVDLHLLTGRDTVPLRAGGPETSDTRMPTCRQVSLRWMS